MRGSWPALFRAVSLFVRSKGTVPVISTAHNRSVTVAAQFRLSSFFAASELRVSGSRFWRS